jgi:hypothetical protein
MARPRDGILFTEAAGKTVVSIRYDESGLEIHFTVGTLFSFELSSRLKVEASYLEQRGGESAVIRKYGRLSADSCHET